jgi:broad specificity phosphatase PhoE
VRIFIVRHGDPDYEHDTLTEKGHREASLLAEKLKKEKIDYIYTSPLGRAKDTCAYTARALGMDGEAGSICEGKRADFAVLDDKFNVLYTVCGGKIIYKA